MDAKRKRGRPKGSVNKCRGVQSFSKKFYQFSNSINDKENVKSNLLFVKTLNDAGKKVKMQVENRARLMNYKSIKITRKKPIKFKLGGVMNEILKIRRITSENHENVLSKYSDCINVSFGYF